MFDASKIQRGLELAEKATQGEWSKMTHSGNRMMIVIKREGCWIRDICQVIKTRFGDPQKDAEENRDYIVEAANSYPAALMEIKSLQAELAKRDDALTTAYMAGVEEGKDKAREENKRLREALESLAECPSDLTLDNLSVHVPGSLTLEIRERAKIAREALHTKSEGDDDTIS